MKGYALIKNDAEGISAIPLSEFRGKPCIVLEFNELGDALVINAKGTGLAMFDKEAISKSFKCEKFGQFFVPPGLNMIQKIEYVAKYSRIEFNSLTNAAIITNSLVLGRFDDSFLFK